MTPQARPIFIKLLRCALALVTDCECDNAAGCPACVQHTDCSEYNSVINKQAARIVLEEALRAETARTPLS